MLEPVGFSSCNCESNIQEKDAPTRTVQRKRRVNLRLRFRPIEKDAW